jgi:hypothetical protein
VREGLWATPRNDPVVILIIGVLTLVAVSVLIWISVGRDVFRVGYVTITKKQSFEGEDKLTSPNSANRHQGVLHLVMVDHVDSALVLVVLRLDNGGQWISTVRVDQLGFGSKRLDSWRATARRIVVVEKPRAHEVIFRPLATRRAQWSLAQWVNSARMVESSREYDASSSSVDDPAGRNKPIPLLRLFFALILGVISIISSLVLMCTDGIAGGVSWTHHAGISAAPLLLVAGALLAVSIAVPPTGKSAVLRVVTITAFTTWGLSQLLPNTGAGTLLDDFAILLFVIDAGVFVASDSVGLLRTRNRGGQDAEVKPAQSVDAPEAGRAA